MKVALVGGGFLGMAVARALGPGTVVATRTGRWRDGEPPSGVRMHALDLTAESLDVEPLRGCEALHVAVAPGGHGTDRRTLYVEGITRLLQQTAGFGWRRIVHIGSTSALPAVDGWMFESQTRRPETERGAIQRDAEDRVLAFAQQHRVPTVVLRLGGLYGPGRALGRLYRDRSGEPQPGSGNAPTNLIHLEDAVQASLAALGAPAHVGGVVHVVDDDHATRRTMYDEVARAQGRAALRWERDVAPAEPPHGKRVSNGRLKFELGVRLKHPTHRWRS